MPKKGKNFREVIEDEKNKGRTTKRIMHAITSLNASLIYGGSFLLLFFVLASIFYFVLTPSVFLWAGILLVAALVSSLFASRVTNMLKNNQWKYTG
ncbi:MAG: hypothetical protein ACQCN6_09890 [Candidatus Bathyarchaeia archaeon]